MSGHSKWSQIKRQKGAADAKRGQTFTKMANSIIVAVKEGGSGDPATNFRLAQVLDQARAVNMPKDNIGRAIEKGLGKGGAGALENLTYEGYGPAGVALLVEVLTDNRNRTASEVKSLIERSGGSLSGPGAVAWMFQKRGLISVSLSGKTFDDIFSAAADAGATDVEEAGETIEIYTDDADLKKVKDALEAAGFTIVSTDIVYQPTQTVSVSETEKAKAVLSLMDKLDSLDDVVRVNANFDIPDNLLEGIEDKS